MTVFKNYDGIDPAGEPIKLTIASGPVIIENNKVLLDKHGDDNVWKFPGGRLPDDVSVYQNAISRVNEELGIKVKLKGEPYLLFVERSTSGIKEYIILIHYLAKRIGEVKPGSDIREWAWHDVKNLPSDCAPNIKPVVEYFIKKA